MESKKLTNGLKVPGNHCYEVRFWANPYAHYMAVMVDVSPKWRKPMSRVTVYG